MKKTILTLTIIILVLVLTACNSNIDGTATRSTNGVEAGVLNRDREFSMPTDTKMMLGIVKLDETDVSVDADQASEFLPLFKALCSLSESDTAAQTEIDALVSQIEETMTPEQISTIESMDLTMQDMGDVMETLGIDNNNFGNFGEITPEMRATMEARRESGEFTPPSDGVFFFGPGGGQGPGGFGGAEMDPEAQATAIAERGGFHGAVSGINSFLLDAIIEFLEAKIQ